MCQIETDGRGLYLGQTSDKGFATVGNSLYLMKQGGLYDGRGPILDPNSPFKNILYIQILEIISILTSMLFIVRIVPYFQTREIPMCSVYYEILGDY